MFVKSFHSPCGNGKSGNVFFFRCQQLDLLFASEGVLKETMASSEQLRPDCCAKQSVGSLSSHRERRH